VLQTLSKAWGLAGLRIGMAFAGEEIIHTFNKVKPPYNISQATNELALQALENVNQVNEWIREIVIERDLLSAALVQLPEVLHVYPSDASFILVRTTDAKGIYNHLIEQGIVVRDRSKVELCMGCLRISIGTPAENLRLLEVLKTFNLKKETTIPA
jgi:histidinol-phosphate aminotransferase